jgi:Ion channel
MAVAARERLAPKSRVARLRAAHSYRSVFLLILITFVFISLAGDGTWTGSVLLLLGCGMLATALWTSGFARAGSTPLRGLVVLGAALAVLLIFSDRDWVVGAGAIVTALLILATIVTVAIGVIDQGTVNVQSVTGAICIYLLLGVFFVFLYGAVAALGSGNFFAQGTDGTRSLRMYFSFVTLATLGYGDYTPAGNLGHTLAITEALLGQIYLVTVVAVLVARLGHVRES